MKGFISAMILIFTLFLIVLVKMEERRMGYEIFYLQRQAAEAQEELRHQQLKMAELLKPDYVRERAKSFLELDWARSRQIIYLTGREH